MTNTKVTSDVLNDGAVTEAKLNTNATIQTNVIGGLLLSNDTETDNDVNIMAGGARDTTDSVNLILASEITKQIDASWAVGDDAGGLDGTESSGGTPDADTMYYVWLIRRSDTGVVDALFSESATSPTLPTNYDSKRLIGVVRTDSSGDIIGFTQVGDYFRYTGDVILDVDDSSITASFETATLSVPPSSIAHTYVDVIGTSGTTITGSAYIKTNGAADVAARPEAGLFFELQSATSHSAILLGTHLSVLVDESSQIQYAGEASSSTIKISTYGFTMLTRSNP